MPRKVKSKKISHSLPKSSQKKSQALKVLLVVRDDIVTQFFEAAPGEADDDQLSARMVDILWNKDFISADELNALSSKLVNFKKVQNSHLMDKVADRVKLLSFKGGRDNALKGAWLQVMGDKFDNITTQLDSLKNEQLEVYQSMYSSLMAETEYRGENPIKITSPRGNIILKILRVAADDSNRTG